MPHVTSHPHGNFAWYDLFAKDIEASKSFYTALFGWTVEDQPTDPNGGGPYAMYMKDGRPVAGVGQMSPEMMEAGTPQTWNAYVTVHELEPVLARVEENGGKVIFPAMDVGDVGRLAYFADPEGAILALWQPKKNIGAGIVHEADTVCWVELASRDMHAAKDFYARVFGWTDVDNPSGPPTGYRTLKNGDAEIGGILQMTEEWGDMPAHWSLYFETDGIAATTGKLVAHGGEVKFGPFEAPVGQIAVCADPGGAHFYLIELSDAMKAER